MKLLRSTLLVLIGLLVCSGGLYATGPVAITGTIYNAASGGTANGSITVENLQPFLADDGHYVGPTQLVYKVTSGVPSPSISLEPSTDSTPTFSYKVTYRLGSGAPVICYWAVPTTTAAISAIETCSAPAAGSGSQAISASTLSTATNCTSSASPAVCSTAIAGSVVVAASATTVVVNTTAVTANSQIFIQRDSSLGTKLGVTCNTQSSLVIGPGRVTARTAATSFTITLEVGPTTNPACFSYFIIN